MYSHGVDHSHGQEIEKYFLVDLQDCNSQSLRSTPFMYSGTTFGFDLHSLWHLGGIATIFLVWTVKSLVMASCPSIEGRAFLCQCYRTLYFLTLFPASLSACSSGLFIQCHSIFLSCSQWIRLGDEYQLSTCTLHPLSVRPPFSKRFTTTFILTREGDGVPGFTQQRLYTFKPLHSAHTRVPGGAP